MGERGEGDFARVTVPRAAGDDTGEQRPSQSGRTAAAERDEGNHQQRDGERQERIHTERPFGSETMARGLGRTAGAPAGRGRGRNGERSSPLFWAGKPSKSE